MIHLDESVTTQEALRQTLFEFRLSAAQLARDTGLTKAQISLFKNGERDLTTQSWVKLVRALPVEARLYYLDLLFGLKLVQSKNLPTTLTGNTNEEIQNIYRNVREISESKIENIIQNLEVLKQRCDPKNENLFVSLQRQLRELGETLATVNTQSKFDEILDAISEFEREEAILFLKERAECIRELYLESIRQDSLNKAREKLGLPARITSSDTLPSYIAIMRELKELQGLRFSQQAVSELTQLVQRRITRYFDRSLKEYSLHLGVPMEQVQQFIKGDIQNIISVFLERLAPDLTNPDTKQPFIDANELALWSGLIDTSHP